MARIAQLACHLAASACRRGARSWPATPAGSQRGGRASWRRCDRCRAWSCRPTPRRRCGISPAFPRPGVIPDAHLLLGALAAGLRFPPRSSTLLGFAGGRPGFGSSKRSRRRARSASGKRSNVGPALAAGPGSSVPQRRQQRWSVVRAALLFVHRRRRRRRRIGSAASAASASAAAPASVPSSARSSYWRRRRAHLLGRAQLHVRGQLLHFRAGDIGRPGLGQRQGGGIVPGPPGCKISDSPLEQPDVPRGGGVARLALGRRPRRLVESARTRCSAN